MTDSQLALILSASSATVALMSFTWSIGWSVWQFRRLHRPRLTVLVTNALPMPRFGGVGPWCVGVTIVNDGAIAVTLTSLKFVVRDDVQRQGLFPMTWVNCDPTALPLKLMPGERWNGLTERHLLIETLHEHFGDRSEFETWVIATD